MCYIYFSSNDLYVKDLETDFRKKIIKNDRYEWVNRTVKGNPELEIFIRDIWLSWYVNVVNKELASLNNLISYLKEVTKGYMVTTAGVSSVGYVATIVATKLSAIRCFDFSGQFSLLHHFNHIINNPFLKNYYAEHPDGGNFEAWQLIKNANSNILCLPKNNGH